MKKETVVIAVMALIIVVLGGFLISKMSQKKEDHASPSAVPAGSGSPVDYQHRIAELERVVAGDPKNLQAWTMLANEYYDTDQPQKAIDAYGKALALSPDNPNLLTDQGVMYKRLGESDRAGGNEGKARVNFGKAMANFEKAQRIDPSHLQSLYNMGIVYSEDLKQPENALKIWNGYLKLDPTSPAAQQVKRMMEQAEAAMRSGVK